MESRTPTPLLHVAFALIIGLFLAIFLGYATVEGSFLKISAILALGPIFILILGFQYRIWLIIPFLVSFYGKLAFLPLPFTVRELAIMATFGTFILLVIFKKLPGRGRYDFLDALLLINIVYLGTVFLRNPVGARILGTELVGGRPYFIVAIACMLYWIYSHVSVGPKLAFYLPLIALAGSFITFLIWLVSYAVPSTAGIISRVYTGVDFEALLSDVAGIESETTVVRLSGLGNFGLTAMMCLIAYFPPLTLLSPLYFGRFLAFAASSAGILMGGFRSKLATMILYFLTASFFRGGIIDVFRTAFLGLAAFFILVGFHFTGLYHLPLTAQRALSFLPMEWDYDAIESAQGSSEWRFQMWQDVWESDSWIKNKWLGDGFGFSRYELNIMLDAQLGGKGFLGGDVTESQKIQGAYHNGPLSAIRVVGVLGFIFYMVMAIGVSLKSFSLIRRTMGTPYQPMAFMTIPLIFAPLVFVFIFGAYNEDFPSTIASIASLKLLSRSFDDYLASLPATTPPREAESKNLESKLISAS